MSFDKDTRNALAKMVNACRRTLTEDVTNQLQETFGLYSDTSLPLDSLTHLTLDEAEAAQALREQLDHFAAAESGRPEERRRLAYDRLILEIAFTILNRLAALRLCEDRELVIECVREGTSSDGFRLFNSISGGALGSIHETYRIFLECMMDELALDLGVLFDRANPQSAVFPTDRCLKEILDLLNDPDLAFVWSEDETIGWIYQYFNPPEERRAMREASQTPRNSRELAVRNQFFTPRYVVEFLTDNTLGRIWYEMRKGKTSLAEQCRYLVRRPNEMFLDLGEEPPVEDDHEKDFSQEELLNRPVYILHRPKKDPRDIKSLDPACGSAHFLLYDFDLMETIYVEAWNDLESPASEATGRTLHEDYSTFEELRLAVPELILRHNLHGIDIDIRAVQIAAFALWLRAQRSWKVQGIKAKARPRITKSNIVCAEPMPGEEDMRQDFTSCLKPRVLGQLVDVVFDKMKLAGEAGSLLKIEVEIKDVVAEARKQWLEGPKPKQQLLFPDTAEIQPKERDLHFNLKGITDDRFWMQVEDRILEVLKEYTEQEENGHAVRRQLFADDTAHGFSFIDLCRKHYDVVLMNPPFGEPAANSKSYLLHAYRKSKNDVFAAFIESGLRLLASGGALGAITSRTGFFLSAFEAWRSDIVLGLACPLVFCDLGSGVLDTATVETAAYVLGQTQVWSAIPFIRLLDSEQKAHDLYEEILAIRSETIGSKTSLSTPASFRYLPGAPFAYWVSPRVRGLFEHLPLLRHKCSVDMGMSTKDDDRFVRLRWEVAPESIGWGAKYRYYAKGGSSIATHLSIDCVVLGESDFKELKANLNQKYPYLKGDTDWVLHPEYHYGQEGLTFGRRVRRFKPHPLPRGIYFSDNNPSIFPSQKDDLIWLSAYLSSHIVQCLLGLFAPPRHMEVGYVGNIPYPSPDPETRARLSKIGLKQYQRGIERSLTNETDAQFLVSRFFLRTFSTVEENNVHEVDIDNLIACMLGLEERDLHALLSTFSSATGLSEYDNDPGEEIMQGDYGSLKSRKDISEWLARDILSYSIGASIGRWDVRIALDSSLFPKLLNPFDQLPVCPPGMLVGPEGLPAEPRRIASVEWIYARLNSNLTAPAVEKPAITDDLYPLRISWGGILVDDPGFNHTQPHRDDIIKRIRDVLDLLCNEKADEVEQEICRILGISKLRDYFRRPSGFFQDHLKRYSMSRRKAPIYWPLSTVSGSYTIWIYYHRLTHQTLYSVLNDYLEPKITEVDREISRTEEKLKAVSGGGANHLRDKINNGRTLLTELKDLRQEILRIAALPYKPDLNDGVMINAAPFHKLFRLRSWAEDTEEVWNKLERGEYDWSHLAYVLWPDRVKEVCRKDRSIAVAHGLEDICQTPAPSSSKGTRGRRGRRSRRAA